MTENKSEEKLLPPIREKTLIESGTNRPLLSTHDFLKNTSPHELNNIFGSTEEKINPPFIVPSKNVTGTAPLKVPSFLPPIPKKDSEKIIDSLKTVPVLPPATEPKSEKTKIATAFFLILLVFVVILYIWGGVVKN